MFYIYEHNLKIKNVMKREVLFLMLIIFVSLGIHPLSAYEKDSLKTSNNKKIVITFIKHGSLMFEYNNRIIHVDPVLRMGNYSELPGADLILVTHHHGDHWDLNAIEKVRKQNTRIIATHKCMENTEELTDVIIMENGDEKSIAGLDIHAVPAYNIKHKRDNGEPYHVKGQGNGYVVQFFDKKIYIAGDTENIPEMRQLENIDVAFLPMNLPYTMSPDMAADAAKMFRPKILYPYHFGKTDPSKLVDLLQDEEDIEVRIRDMGF
jgi:L-ascorbate metabolism protein UlaG (beta-lactamase superfamily)